MKDINRSQAIWYGSRATGYYKKLYMTIYGDYKTLFEDDSCVPLNKYCFASFFFTIRLSERTVTIEDALSKESSTMGRQAIAF
jgi:hypothetical protein